MTIKALHDGPFRLLVARSLYYCSSVSFLLNDWKLFGFSGSWL